MIAQWDDNDYVYLARTNLTLDVANPVQSSTVVGEKGFNWIKYGLYTGNGAALILTITDVGSFSVNSVKETIGPLRPFVMGYLRILEYRDYNIKFDVTGIAAAPPVYVSIVTIRSPPGWPMVC